MLALILVILSGCTDNDLPIEVAEVWQAEEEALPGTSSTDSAFQSCDSVFIAGSRGTACCVGGPILAKPASIARYHYQINHGDPRVEWQILEGDISILAGQGTPTVTVHFGANFQTGIVFGDGNGVYRDTEDRLRCTDRVIVTIE